MKQIVLMSSAVLALTAVGCTAGVAYYGYLFYDHYLRWRGCFNEAGYCDYTDAAGIEHRVWEQQGLLFGVLAVGCAIGAAIWAALAWWSWHRYRSKADAGVSPWPRATGSPRITKEVGPPPLLRRSPQPPSPQYPHLDV